MGTPEATESEPHPHKRPAILMSALAAGLLAGALAATFIIMRRRRHTAEPTERAERLVHACYDLIGKIEERLSGLGAQLADAPRASAAKQ